MEAELSDWLSTETADKDKRRRAEELFRNYDHVEVSIKDGKFAKVCGSEADINELETDLMKTYAERDGLSESCNRDLAAVNGQSSISYETPVENMQQQQQDELAVRTSPQHVHTSIHTASPVRTADDTAGSSHDLIPPAQKRHSGARVKDLSTEKRYERFVDEMDVEKYVYHYMLFTNAHAMGELASNFHCGVGLKRSAVDVNGRTQYRLQVTANTQDGLASAYDALAEMVVKCADAKIMEQKVELCPSEYFDELKEELKKKDILLMSSPCHVVGPASALESAQSVVRAAVNEIYARMLPPFAVSIDYVDTDIFLFHIPLAGLTVHVSQGML